MTTLIPKFERDSTNINRAISSKLSDVVSITDFMTQAEIDDANENTFLYDHAPALQAFVNYVITNQTSGYINVRNLHVKSTINFPGATPGTGNSYRIYGDGPTGTSISEYVTPGSSVRTNPVSPIFHFNAEAGPAIIIEKISINGPEGLPGIYGGTGFYFSSSNGITLRDCWARGLSIGFHKPNTSSYICFDYCLAEFCVVGMQFEDGIECFVTNTQFYRCLTNMSLSGIFYLSSITNSMHSEMVYYGIELNGANSCVINNVTAVQVFQTYLPDIIILQNNSNNNFIDGVYTTNFGRTLISFQAAGNNVNNKFTNIQARLTTTIPGGLAPPAGTMGVGLEIGTTNSGNVFNNFVFDKCHTGIIDAAGENYYTNGQIYTSTTAGVSLQGADKTQWSNINFAGNTVDWATIGTIPTIWMSSVVSDLSGIAYQRLGSLGAGLYGRTFYETAIPTILAYLKGDVVINTNPTVGQPKSWVCTVAGTPGTWVSQGNL